MPVSEQIVVRCDGPDCDQMLTLNSGTTDGPVADAADQLMADRSWSKLKVNRAATTKRVFCPTHTVELQKYLGGPATAVAGP